MKFSKSIKILVFVSFHPDPDSLKIVYYLKNVLSSSFSRVLPSLLFHFRFSYYAQPKLGCYIWQDSFGAVGPDLLQM